MVLHKNQSLNFSLTPKTSQDSYKIYFKLDNKVDNIDKDLNLQIETYDGKICTVTPINTDCPYAKHIRDVKSGEKGSEIIEIKKWLKAYYMVYVSEGGKYGTCANAKYLKNQHKFSNTESNYQVWTSGEEEIN